jgi:preprotein translocase subunit SecG
MTFFFYLTMIAFVAVCLFMILLVLVQKGRGGGLASAFGGMGGNTAFGSKTGDVLTWTTAVVFGIFVVLAVVLNFISNRIAHPTTPASAGTAATAVGAPAAGVAGDTAGPPDTAPPLPAAGSINTPTTAPATQAAAQTGDVTMTTAPAAPTPNTPLPTGVNNVLNAPPATAPAAAPTTQP